jgi:hypothetical protein
MLGLNHLDKKFNKTQDAKDCKSLVQDNRLSQPRNTESANL